MPTSSLYARLCARYARRYAQNGWWICALGSLSLKGERDPLSARAHIRHPRPGAYQRRAHMRNSSLGKMLARSVSCISRPCRNRPLRRDSLARCHTRAREGQARSSRRARQMLIDRRCTEQTVTALHRTTQYRRTNTLTGRKQSRYSSGNLATKLPDEILGTIERQRGARTRCRALD